MRLPGLRTRLIGITIAMVLGLFAPRAHAVGEAPTIDGNLADLISAVAANSGSSQGGFAFDDDAIDGPGDVFTGLCKYVNGYDISKAYAYFRFKDGSGAFTPNNVTLYLGWQVRGQIGDVDGDGNPGTFTCSSGQPCDNCALSDGGGSGTCSPTGTGVAAGIGAGENYSILLNLNCTGPTELRLGVSNNQVAVLTNGGDVLTPISGAFCRNGSFLEVRIDHYEQLIAAVDPAIGADLCKTQLRMAANAGDDGLGEDITAAATLNIPPSVTITKLPASQDACPGTNVSWTIQVCNNGICPLATVNVSDTLGVGLTYVSDDKGSSQGSTAQIRNWSFGNLGIGQCQTISLTAKVDFPCAAAQLVNDVGVEGNTGPSACSPEGLASAHAHAVVNCTQPSVDIQKVVGPKTLNPGEKTTVTLTIQNTGDSVLDPINVCDKLDAGVTFDAAQAIGGSCGVTLLSNTLNGDGTRTICFSPFSLAADGSCTISYQVGCATVGEHPDTATVVAFCKGESQNSVTDKAFDSFTCGAPPCVTTNTIKSNFNGTSIVGVGNKPAYVWFNSNFTVKKGTITPGTQIRLRQSIVVINGTSYNVPDATITFQSVSCASTSFDPGTKTWNTTVPLAGSDEIFLTGLVLPLLSLQGGATVSWSGSFDTDTPGLCISWKWGAAVYKSWPLRSADPFDVDYNAANIKPTHSAACGISNGDHAGTPQNPTVRSNVTGGARGGGGSNFTGSWSGTASVCLECPPPGVSYERSGGSRELRPMGQEGDAIASVELYRPVPNPFQNSTTIAYAIGGTGQSVSIGIYDVAGRLIRTMADGFRPAGRYQVVWDGRSADGSTVAGGVYFLRAYVGGQRMAADATRILYLR